MNKGFTLIEIMVAVSIFVIVAVVATGALVTVSNVNRRAQAVKTAMDNVAFAMDSMVLNFREGEQFGCPISPTGEPIEGSPSDLEDAYLNRGCTTVTGGQAVIFRSKRPGSLKDVPIVYRFHQDENGVGRLQSARGSDPNYSYITSDEINIDEVKFYAPNVGSDSTLWPWVTIIIRGAVTGQEASSFTIQTTAKANY